MPATVKTVLIVEDNEDAAETLGLLLQIEGYQVQIAYDGRNAMKLAYHSMPDIALLDIGLPDMNGYDLARALRKHSRSSLLLVATTGWARESDREAALEAGFDEHLQKPIPPEKLLAILADHCLKSSRTATDEMLNPKPGE